ncbi:MAG TPA: hypothetical protein VNA20_10365 [Frankiaceae bacterium]|nr:hypothetical protein [Frankiaceae bacterium]
MDDLLQPGYRSGTHVQRVDTVANTLFPRALYRTPGFRWAPELPVEQATAHDEAAANLYDAYDAMLPMLRTVPVNMRGTYFGRMIDWPTRKNGERTNQLMDRIEVLRRARRSRHSRSNIADIAIAGDAEGEPLTDDPAAGLQVFAATDKRIYSFPCLVHVDLSVHGGKLHLLAVYRHWYVITKGYGNLLGLSDLLTFLCDQTGYPLGELVVVAGMADTEPKTYGGRRGINDLVVKAKAVSA